MGQPVGKYVRSYLRGLFLSAAGIIGCIRGVFAGKISQRVDLQLAAFITRMQKNIKKIMIVPKCHILNVKRVSLKAMFPKLCYRLDG